MPTHLGDDPNVTYRDAQTMLGTTGIPGDTKAVRQDPEAGKPRRMAPFEFDALSGLNALSAVILGIFVVTISVLSVPL